jgi:hypothetical protein
MKKPASLLLNMTSPEGRAMIQVSIEALSSAERGWLLKLLRSAEKGSQVGFGVAEEDGVPAIKFRIGQPETVQ